MSYSTEDAEHDHEILHGGFAPAHVCPDCGAPLAAQHREWCAELADERAWDEAEVQP